jgi:DNA-binding MarR family transcriptional regulator
MTDRPRPSPDEIDAVMRAAQLLVAISARSLAAIETEVSLPQLRVLVILASQGPRSLNAVAQNLNIHPSNATRACDKLVAAGLIRRAEDRQDRRLLALSLTGLGSELVEKVMRYRREQIEALLNEVPAPQRTALASALDALSAAGDETLKQSAWQAGWTTVSGNHQPGELSHRRSGGLDPA